MKLGQCYDNPLRLTGYAATPSVVRGGYAETVTMYSQALGYDAFGNLTSRETDVWGDEGGFSAVYSNGRKLNAEEIYDNAGNLVSNPIATNVYDGWAFDASGRNMRTVMAWDESLQRRKDTISNLLDGDGRAVKRVDLKETWVRSAPPEYLSSTKTEYYIRSSVLGGKVLTELREDETKKRTNVYTGDAVIAEQMSFPADEQHSTEWASGNSRKPDHEKRETKPKRTKLALNAKAARSKGEIERLRISLVLRAGFRKQHAGYFRGFRVLVSWVSW